jgi:chloramphenicol O-acetyltransferase
LTNEELSLLKNSTPLVEHLADGRVREINSKVILHQSSSCIYIIITPAGETFRVVSLKESANIIKVNIKTLSKYLDDKNEITLKNYIIKRIRVFAK